MEANPTCLKATITFVCHFGMGKLRRQLRQSGATRMILGFVCLRLCAWNWAQHGQLCGTHRCGGSVRTRMFTTSHFRLGVMCAGARLLPPSFPTHTAHSIPWISHGGVFIRSASMGIPSDKCAIREFLNRTSFASKSSFVWPDLEKGIFTLIHWRMHYYL